MILGPIVWSLKTGTQHRGAFVIPIAYLILDSQVFPAASFQNFRFPTGIYDFSKMEFTICTGNRDKCTLNKKSLKSPMSFEHHFRMIIAESERRTRD